MSTFLDLATSLQATLKALQMYTGAHPRSRSALDNLATLLGDWLQERPSVHIAASAQKIFLDGNPVEGQSLHLTALHRQLSERQISGLIIQRGVPPEELQALLEILILKPLRIEEQGGISTIMAQRDLKYVSLSQTQYKAVLGGEGGAEDGAPSAPVKEKPAPDPLPWTQALAAALAAGGPVNLAPMGRVATTLGWGDDLPEAISLEGLRASLQDLGPESQLSVVSGMNSLPQSPAGLRLAFQALSPDILAQAVAGMLAKGASREAIQEEVFELLRFSGQRKPLLEALGGLLGAGGSTFQSLMNRLDWDGLPLEARIQRAAEGGVLWELSLDQRLSFLQELLATGHTELFLQFLDQLLEALPQEDLIRREIAAHTLAGVAHWMEHPGLPLEAEGPLISGLTAHFSWEPVLHIHRPTIEALEAVCAGLLSKGELQTTLSLVTELEALCTFAAEDQDWRLHGIQRLNDRLRSPELLNLVQLSATFQDPDQLLPVVVPYFEHLGDRGVDYLVERLGEEPDRRRRALFMNTIRALGGLAVPALERSLHSQTWYLVRNTLNLLADLGNAGLVESVSSCMRHTDKRVRQAAVRATWKLAGPAAGVPLQTLLLETDSETQLEVLFGLGQIQASGAVPAIGALASDGKAALPLRVKAVDTLALIAHPGAIPQLTSLLQRKGRIFTTAEPQELRLAAAKALKAIHTPEALGALSRVIDSEGRSQDRELLKMVMESE